MKLDRFCLIFCCVLASFFVGPFKVAKSYADELFLKEVQLEQQSINGEVFYNYNSDISLSFNSSNNDTSDDFGLRFSVIRVSDSGNEILYTSRGSGDSYILRPTFFVDGNNKGPLLILAETGTEYSWGSRVFLLNQKYSVTDLGSLEVSAKPDLEFADTSESIIPFTKIIVDGERYEFTFAKDVVFDPGGLNEAVMGKNQIKYVFDGTTLNCILNTE